MPLQCYLEKTQVIGFSLNPISSLNNIYDSASENKSAGGDFHSLGIRYINVKGWRTQSKNVTKADNKNL